MTAYELHDLLSSNRELVSDTWYYFLTVHLAIFAIVHVASAPARLHERLLLFVAYLGFLIVNFRAQTDNYAAQLRLIDEIRAAPAESAAALLGAEDVAWIIDYLPHVYMGVAAFAAVIILSAHRN